MKTGLVPFENGTKLTGKGLGDEVPFQTLKTQTQQGNRPGNQ